MLFPTFDFLLFVVPVLLGTWALSSRPRLRMLWLLVASYFFYMAGPKTDPPPTPWYYAGILLASTVLDFVCAARIHALDADLDRGGGRAERARRHRKAWLAASLLGNLGTLGYFKYTNFLLEAVADVGRTLGLEVSAHQLEVVLPIGISFYTFQTMSYTLDVYRRTLVPERSFLRFALFVVFFPQLVAGPIVRASEFLPQLHRPPGLDPSGRDEALFRIFKGLIKKVVLGDLVAARFTDAVFAAPSTYTSAELVLALYAFTLQLYADFSGYSDIAIGVARLFGYRLPENFDRPYQARDVGEFWRRWHMTLSTWLRDYLFFPLGGSKGSPSRTYFNLWVTMFLVGMWHGASWNFVVYGNLHAFAMIFNRWNRLRTRSPSFLGELAVAAVAAVLVGLGVAVLSHALDLSMADGAWLVGLSAACAIVLVILPVTVSRWNVFVHVATTFHFTVLSRVFFRAEDLETSREMIEGILGFDAHGLRPGLLDPWLWAALVLGLAYHFTPRAWVDRSGHALFRRLPGPAIGLLYALLGLALARLLGEGPRAFIYFQF